jgi:hypothetical protein
VRVGECGGRVAVLECGAEPCRTAPAPLRETISRGDQTVDRREVSAQRTVEQQVGKAGPDATAHVEDRALDRGARDGVDRRDVGRAERGRLVDDQAVVPGPPPSWARDLGEGVLGAGELPQRGGRSVGRHGSGSARPARSQEHTSPRGRRPRDLVHPLVEQEPTPGVETPLSFMLRGAQIVEVRNGEDTMVGSGNGSKRSVEIHGAKDDASNWSDTFPELASLLPGGFRWWSRRAR